MFKRIFMFFFENKIDRMDRLSIEDISLAGKRHNFPATIDPLKNLSSRELSKIDYWMAKAEKTNVSKAWELPKLSFNQNRKVHKWMRTTENLPVNWKKTPSFLESIFAWIKFRYHLWIIYRMEKKIKNNHSKA